MARTVWTPVTEGDEIPIAKDLLVKPLRNGHVPVEEHIIKSLGYMVVQTRKKLRPEFAHLSGEQLRQLAEQQGRDSFSMEVRENLFGYSGDTPVEDGAKWDNTRILIHEATFLDNGEPVKSRDYGITERSEGYGRSRKATNEEERGTTFRRSSERGTQLRRSTTVAWKK